MSFKSTRTLKFLLATWFQIEKVKSPVHSHAKLIQPSGCIVPKLALLYDVHDDADAVPVSVTAGLVLLLLLYAELGQRRFLDYQVLHCMHDIKAGKKGHQRLPVPQF